MLLINIFFLVDNFNDSSNENNINTSSNHFRGKYLLLNFDKLNNFEIIIYFMFINLGSSSKKLSKIFKKFQINTNDGK